MSDGAAGRDHLAPRKMLHVVRSELRPGSFPLLLGTTVVLYVLKALAIQSETGELLGRLVYAAVVVASLYFLSLRRMTLLVGALAITVTAVLQLVPVLSDPRSEDLLQDGVTAGFHAWVLIVVLRETFAAGTSARDAVIGALGGFVLLILSFARIHGLVDVWEPGAYSFSGGAPDAASNAQMIAAFQYFSTVTTTTVGYGDIVPVSRVARLVTGLQAIMGQLYVAVVVAALVGRATTRGQRS